MSARKLEWCTTMPNPTIYSRGPDQGQRGWKLHLVELGKTTNVRFRGYVISTIVDVSPALCGLRPRHGWGLDMFICDVCERCEAVAARNNLSIPKL